MASARSEDAPTQASHEARAVTGGATRPHPVALQPVAWIAAIFVVLQLAPLAGSSYGTFIDEFYYYACSDRLDWGYVDHPPLSIALLALTRALLGESLFAARLVAALCGVATLFAGATMAARMGADRFGQLLAAIAIGCTPVLIAIFGFYSMNAIEILLWSVTCLLLVEVLLGGDAGRWRWIGLVLGLAIMNKHTTLLFVAGLGLGVIATKARGVLRERQLWVGVAIAFLIISPNLAWQWQHDWVSLEFYRNAAAKNIPTSPLEALINHILSFNPGTLPVWGTGLWLLLREPRLRPLGLLAAMLLSWMIFSGLSRPDRVAGIAPLLMAAGGAYWAGALRPALRGALLAFPVAIAAVLSPVFFPILPPAMLARYAATLGVVPEIEAHDTPLALPQWFADRLEWPEYVQAVEAAFVGLTAPERSRAIILTRNYGAAGALERLGRGLPPVHALHNSYHAWGPPQPFEVAITVQLSEQELRRYFASVEQVGVHQCRFCRQFRHPVPIFVARGLRRPIEEVWSELGYSL